MQIRQIIVAANQETNDTVIHRILSENMPFTLSELHWTQTVSVKQSGHEQAICDISGMRVVLTRLVDDIGLVSLSCTATSDLGAQSLLGILSDLVARSFKPAEADGVWIKAFDAFNQPITAHQRDEQSFTSQLRDFRRHRNLLFYVVRETKVERHRDSDFPLSWKEFKTFLGTLEGQIKPSNWSQANASLLTDMLELTCGGLWEFGHFQKIYHPNTKIYEAINSTSLLQTAAGEILEPRPDQDILAVITRHDVWKCPTWVLVLYGLLMAHTTAVSVSQLIKEVEERI